MNADPARPRVTTQHEAIDHSEGMSLDDLAAFVQEAMRLGHDGATHPKVRATMRGRIRDIRITSTPARI